MMMILFLLQKLLEKLIFKQSTTRTHNINIKNKCLSKYFDEFYSLAATEQVIKK